MYKTLRKVLLLFLVTAAFVCGTLFAVACGKKDDDEVKVPELSAPTGVDIDDDGVLSWNAVDNASGYIVYDGNSAIKNDIASDVHSYDLNDANLAAGNHSISVAAKGDGVNYNDSPKSSPAVSYYVPGDEADGSLEHPYKLDEDFQANTVGQLVRNISIDLGANETIYYWAKLSEIKSFVFVSLEAPGLVISVYSDPASDVIVTIEADSDNDDLLEGEVVVDADKDYYFAFSIVDGSAASYYVKVIKTDVVVDVPGSSADNPIEITSLGVVNVNNLETWGDRYYSYTVTSADEKLYFSKNESNINLVVSYVNDNDETVSFWSSNPDELKQLIAGVQFPVDTKIIISVTNLGATGDVSFVIDNQPIEEVPADPIELLPPENVAIQGKVLSWNKVNDASGYIVYKDNEEVSTINNVNILSYQIPDNLEPGTYHYSVAAKGDGENYLTSVPSSPAVEYVVGHSYNLTIGTALNDVVIGTSASPTTLILSGIDASGWTQYDVSIVAASGLTITLVHGSVSYPLSYDNGSYVFGNGAQYLFNTSVQLYASEEVTASVTISAHVEEEDDSLVFELGVEKEISLDYNQFETYTFTATEAGTYKIELIGDIAYGDVWVNNGTPLLNDDIQSLEAEFKVSAVSEEGTPVYFDISCHKAGGVTFKAKITFVKGLDAEGNEFTVSVPGVYGSDTVLTLSNLVEGKAYYLFEKECDQNLSRNWIYVTYNNVQYTITSAHRAVAFVATSETDVKISSNAMGAAGWATATFVLGDALGVNGDSYTPDIEGSDVNLYVAGIKVGKEYTVALNKVAAFSRMTITLKYNGASVGNFVLNNETDKYEAKFTAAEDAGILVNEITISCASFDSSASGMVVVSLVGEVDEDGGDSAIEKDFVFTISGGAWESSWEYINDLEAGKYTVQVVDLDISASGYFSIKIFDENSGGGSVQKDGGSVEVNVLAGQSIRVQVEGVDATYSFKLIITKV